MPRPDTGNFNRLLTSLGLLFLAVSLVVPYFYFRNTDTLRIPVKELRGLTTTGRSTIEGRQSAIEDLEIWVAIGSIGIGLSGIALLVVGGRRLRRAQESEEEEGELRKRRTRAEIQSMSPEQVEDKRDEQAREVASAVAEEPKADSQRGLSPSGSVADTPPGGGSDRWFKADRLYRKRRETIARIEEEVVEVLSAAEFKTHQFLANVSVTSAQTEVGVTLDGLFEARDSTHRDVVLEIKLFDAPSFAGAGPLFVRELIANVARYQALSERPSVGWLLAVVPEARSRDLDVTRIQAVLNRHIQLFGFALVIEEGELASLPGRFRQMIEMGEAKVA